MKNKNTQLDKSKQYRKEPSLPVDLFYEIRYDTPVTMGSNEICISATIKLMDVYDPEYWNKNLIKFIERGLLERAVKVTDDGFVYPNEKEN